MSANLDKLKRLLSELFQLDQADLDFGIYRIMNAKREEITRFLESELLPQVRGPSNTTGAPIGPCSKRNWIEPLRLPGLPGSIRSNRPRSKNCGRR